MPFVVLACKQFVLLCFVYLVLYSFNITLSWSAIMLLNSVLINIIWNCNLCMNEFALMYVYVKMSLCFYAFRFSRLILYETVFYVCMSFLLCMTMYTWAMFYTNVCACTIFFFFCFVMSCNMCLYSYFILVCAFYVIVYSKAH